MLLKDWLHNARGRAVELARALDVSATTVSDWSTGKKPVPLERCPYIERFTEREVTCEELRSDQVEYFAMLRRRPAPLATANQMALVGEGA